MYGQIAVTGSSLSPNESSAARWSEMHFADFRPTIYSLSYLHGSDIEDVAFGVHVKRPVVKFSAGKAPQMFCNETKQRKMNENSIKFH
jgi:hypothetical protein